MHRLRKKEEEKEEREFLAIPGASLLRNSGPNGEEEEIKVEDDDRVLKIQGVKGVYTRGEAWRISFDTHYHASMAFRCYWETHYGGDWMKYATDPELITLAEEAAKSWLDLAEELRQAQKQQPKLVVDNTKRKTSGRGKSKAS